MSFGMFRQNRFACPGSRHSAPHGFRIPMKISNHMEPSRKDSQDCGEELMPV